MPVMPFAGLQDVLVMLLAAAAAVVVLRRVFVFATRESSPACAKCAAGQSCAPAPAASAPVTPHDAHPLVFVRPSQR